MKAFVDSSFFIALAKKDDSTHQKAQNILDNNKDKSIVLYTSYYVIDETVTVLSRRLSKKEALEFLSSIEDSNFPAILNVDQNIREKTYRLFKKVKNKQTSMIDCYSAILMRENKIQKCLTFDEHFKKLGFEIL